MDDLGKDIRGKIPQVWLSAFLRGVSGAAAVLAAIAASIVQYIRRTGATQWKEIAKFNLV